MQRFQHERKSSSKTFIISIVVFFLIAVLFYYGITAVSTRTLKEQEKSLRDTLQRGIIHCYAVEGNYPESLEYLTEHYGISYDKNVFFVDYQPLGANIMPDITIIEKTPKNR